MSGRIEDNVMVAGEGIVINARENGERVDPQTGNAIPVSRERAEYVAAVGPYDRYQAMQDLRDANRGKWLYRIFRRVFDIAFSGAVIAVGLIPGAIVCAAICLESPGCPLYAQKRICRTHRDGRMHVFTMYKFRSMYKDADQRLQELQRCNEVDGAMFKMKEDPRVTKVGKFLRKHSIDEFPQFINVFLGQMTVVGPRPPLPREVEEYDAWAMQRLAVKPGLTGYWQVGGRSDVDFEDMVELDLKYIRERSLWMNFKTILQTIKVVFTGEGAY